MGGPERSQPCGLDLVESELGHETTHTHTLHAKHTHVRIQPHTHANKEAKDGG